MKKNKMILWGSILLAILVTGYVSVAYFCNMNSAKVVAPQNNDPSQQYLARWACDEKTGDNIIQIVGITYHKGKIVTENDIRFYRHFLLEKDKARYEFTGAGYDKLEVTCPEKSDASGEFLDVKIRLKSPRVSLSYDGMLLKNVWMRLNAMQLVIPDNELDVVMEYLQRSHSTRNKS